MFANDHIRKSCELLRDADLVLVAAGAGLSADAGIDYMDTVSFARRFPALVKRGFRMKAELMGYRDWSPEVEWGYLAVHVNDVRFMHPPHPVYGGLLDLVATKDYFVITTNADGMFIRNGFDREKIFTPQGDYSLMQCLKPCRNVTWATKPIIDRILPTVDPYTQEVTDLDVIPQCPNCGGPVFMNVRAGNWFITEPYSAQAEQFESWISRARQHSLLIVELGVGFNTPGVIRWPIERIVYTHPRSHLVRVNLQFPQVPSEIVERSIPLQGRTIEAISAMRQEMIATRDTLSEEIPRHKCKDRM
jgi:NAD-dependent SIR2 family protein deacetylase